jgi:hypothetical protein
MEQISIFNYEAFYLDYLEGNLSEEETKMLLLFLEEHPECRLEEEELVLLDNDTPMTFSGKQNLKQVDEEGPVALDNVEHFMIAEAEGILSEEKTAELNAVVSENQELEATRRRYKAVYYTPDTSMVYGGKADLKQRKAIVLWPYMIGAVAAAAVVAIMFLTGGSDSGLGSISFPKQPSTAQVEQGNHGQSTNTSGNKSGSEVTPVDNTGNNNSGNTYVAQAVKNTTVKSKVEDKPLTRLNPMNPRDFQVSPVNIDGDMASRPNFNTHDWTNVDGYDTQVGFGPDLENPIQPITAFISEKAQTPVEFKRRKATEEKKGGFLLKIGKFEFSRNKH